MLRHMVAAAAVFQFYSASAVAQAESTDVETLYRTASETESRAMRDAVRLYREAAMAGSAKAALRLGDLYRDGAPGVDKDYAESMRWYEIARIRGEDAAARDGSRKAASMRSRMQAEAAASGRNSRSERGSLADEESARNAMETQRPVPVAATKPEEAEMLYKQAYALDKAGNARDAIRIYRRAARAGSGAAAKRLGDVYRCGVNGVPRDYAESLQWYDAARRLGETIPPSQGQQAQSCS